MAKKRKYTKRNTKRRYHKRRNTKRRVRTNQRGGATLAEFKARYAETHAQALLEINAGQKKSCWSWWIWPVSDRDAAGRSYQRKKYSLTDEEARDFLGDPWLRERWLEIMRAVFAQLTGGIHYKTLSGIDDWCLVATCKLFQRVTSDTYYPVVNNVCTNILNVIGQQMGHHKAGQRKATSGPSPNEQKLINMGFSPADVGNALLKTKGDVQLAADLLLTPGGGAPGGGAVSSFPTGGATGRAGRPFIEPCMYGETCYRRGNPEHAAKFSHPGNSDWSSTMATPRGVTPGPRHGAAGGPDPGRAKAGGNQVIIKKGLFSQAAAYEESQRGFTTGILIAGNAGLPGGDLGKKEGWFGSKILDGSGTFWSEPRFYKTQEESVVNSWFHATKLLNHNVQKVFRHNIGDKGQGPDGRPWGLRYTDEPLSGNRDRSTATLQGHDYTESFSDREPGDHIIKYAFCHHVRNQQIAHYPTNSFSEAIRFETSLYFTFGPNVAAVGRDANLGTMARTLVSGYNHGDPYHYYIFRECVKQSFKTSLEMMNNDGIEVPILCRVSGGIYSGVGTQTHTNINGGYEAIINEIIQENIQENPVKFNFVKIILCL